MAREESDFEYYRRRAAEELVKAREAADPGTATKHRQLSSIYTSRSLQAERQVEMDGQEGDAADRGGA